MVDQSRWRHFRKKEERTKQQAYTDLFPGICEKLRADPVRLIETEIRYIGRTSSENNAILVPTFKDIPKSTSLFVERRRYPRHASA